MMFLHASAFLRRLFNHVVSRRRSELCQRLKHGLFLLCDDGQELRAAAGLLTRVAEEPLAVWIHPGLLQYCLQRSEVRDSCRFSRRHLVAFRCKDVYGTSALAAFF